MVTTATFSSVCIFRYADSIVFTCFLIGFQKNAAAGQEGNFVFRTRVGDNSSMATELGGPLMTKTVMENTCATEEVLFNAREAFAVGLIM